MFEQMMDIEQLCNETDKEHLKELEQLSKTLSYRDLVILCSMYMLRHTLSSGAHDECVDLEDTFEQKKQENVKPNPPERMDPGTLIDKLLAKIHQLNQG